MIAKDWIVDKVTVLIVEPDEALRCEARLTLQGQGYAVLEATDPAEARWLSSAPGVQFDLVVTGSSLSGPAGADLVAELRRTNENLRAVLISECPRAGAAPAAVEPPVWFLESPFDLRALADKVQEVLDAAVPIAA